MKFAHTLLGRLWIFIKKHNLMATKNILTLKHNRRKKILHPKKDVPPFKKSKNT